MSQVTFEVLTLFPEIIEAYVSESILGRALQRRIIDVITFNIRDFSSTSYRQVDDYPYGGGAGMVMMAEPIFRAVDFIKEDGKDRYVILLGPGGRTFNQDIAREFAERHGRILLISGRYEGIDDRVRRIVDEELSIGDYVLTGGELPSLVIIDAVSRLLPGVLGDDESSREESFSGRVLEYPQFTRPREYRGLTVPEVLLSGDHARIRRWRRKEALRRTISRRPDLIERANLSEEDKILLKEIKEEKEDESHKGN